MVCLTSLCMLDVPLSTLSFWHIVNAVWWESDICSQPVGWRWFLEWIFIHSFVIQWITADFNIFRPFIWLQNRRENGGFSLVFQNRKVFYFIRLPVLFETNACFPCSVRPFYLPIPDLSVSETVVNSLFRRKNRIFILFVYNSAAGWNGIQEEVVSIFLNFSVFYL